MGYNITQNVSTGQPFLVYTANGDTQVTSAYISNITANPITIELRIAGPTGPFNLSEQIIIPAQVLEAFEVLELPITGIVLKNNYRIFVNAPVGAASINIFTIENGV